MDILFVAAVFVLAGLVKGVIGLGLPTVAMGLLGLAMPPAQAAALLVVPSLVTNAWQLLAGPGLARIVRRLWPMMAGIAVGTALGSGLVAGVGGSGATAALGAALIAYGVVGLARLRLRVSPRAERWAGPAVGAATGWVTGVTGVFAIPAVPYLGSLGFERDELVQALGLSFTVSTIALAAGLAWHDALHWRTAAESLPAVAAALAGMAVGGRLRALVRPETFRRGFFVALLVLGAELVWRGVGIGRG
ncbi:MAG TPA: sulfite exporter TauE/SafE family protein [Burkholderiaceae bacterium]|nr:sulfite exporter TauE/SafE family protein [Burkholderiaceae bacterium]